MKMQVWGLIYSLKYDIKPPVSILTKPLKSGVVMHRSLKTEKEIIMEIKRLRASVRWFIIMSLWTFAVLPAGAEESTTPFITAKYWKQNISLQDFQDNPRVYYRSEGAFQLSRRYAERVTNQSLTDAEFVALLRSERARAISCEGEITTGGLQGDDFYWFDRDCRPGEQKLQLHVDGRWVDFMSLGCLNAVEDKTPALVPLPPITVVPAVEPTPTPEKEKGCRFEKIGVTVQPGMVVSVPSAVSYGCYGMDFVSGITTFVPSSIQTDSELVCD